MELSTRYMGLTLRNPLVASASPLSQTVDGVRQLADAGVGAIVLYSLFEEQLLREAARNEQLVEAGAESFAESLSYFPSRTVEPGSGEIPVYFDFEGAWTSWSGLGPSVSYPLALDLGGNRADGIPALGNRPPDVTT